MKTSVETAILISILFSSMSMLGQNFNNSSVKGNGIMVTRTIKTESYDKIDIRGSLDVVLSKGKEGEITIEAEENVQEFILIESNGEVLSVGFKSNTSLQNIQNIKVSVPFEDISAISVSGSSNVEGLDLISSKTLDLNIKGSGLMSLNIDAAKLNIELGGSGKMKLNGTAKNVNINSRGSGKIDAEKLICENIDANIFGSGRATVHAKNNLKTQIRGSGIVKYVGSPVKVNAKASGSGKTEAL